MNITRSSPPNDRLSWTEALHRTLLETLAEGVFVTGGDGRILFANHRLAEMTGWSRDELIGRDADSLIEKKSLDRLPGRTLQSGRAEISGLALRRRGGGRRWIDLRAAPAPGALGVDSTDGGDPVLCVVQDVTEQREAEESLRHREEYYRALLENSSDLISILDLGGRILFQSQTSRRLLDVSPQEMVGDDLPRFLHEDDRAAFDRAFEAVIAEPGTMASAEVRFRRADGTFVYLESVLRNQLDNEVLAGILVTSRDVTERREVEQALKRERAYFQQLFRNSPAGVVILDNEERVVDANRSFVRLFHFEPDEMRGQSLSDFIVPDELREEATNLSQQVFDRKVVEKETLRLRKDGSPVEVAILGYPIQLAHRKIGAYGMYTDISERKEAERRLYHHAFHDPLTDLPNRELLIRRLQRNLRRAEERSEYRFAILFIDLDRFKRVNDSLGHAAGDELLQEMAKRLEDTLRPGDMVARLGGDEFTLLLERILEPRDATAVAERVLDAVARPVQIDDQEVVVSGSIGIAFSSTGYDEADEILRDADIAMYRAKSRGKSRYEIFDAEMHRAAVERLEIEGELRRAVESGQMELRYQPLVSLEDGAVAGFEALIRWRHPEHGLLAPDRWIHVCEEAGLMPLVGQRVLEACTRQIADWLEIYPDHPGVRISMNASAREITHPHFFEHLFAACESAGIDPRRLGVEVSERSMPDAQDVLAEALVQLREAGLHLSIDDFGTGYSSLATLHRCPIDTLKIDRSFVHSLEEGGESLAIVQAVAAMAESLGIGLVAEGVETAEQLQAVRDLGMAYAQGFFFSEAVEVEEAEALLRDGHSW